MTELATAFRDAGLVQFDPKKAATNDAKADAAINYAKRAKVSVVRVFGTGGGLK